MNRSGPKQAIYSRLVPVLALTTLSLACNLLNDANLEAAKAASQSTSSPAISSSSPPLPIPPSSQPSIPIAIFDKWSLWINGPHLRTEDVHQRLVHPELDHDYFGPGPVGPPLTQGDFDELAALGDNYANLSHPGFYTEKPPYNLDQDIQVNLDRLLNMVAQVDMSAVISFRTGPGRSEFTFTWDEVGDWFDESYLNDSVRGVQAAQDAWAALWRYTAKRSQDNPNVVGHDLMVEPNPNEAGIHALDDALGIWDPEEFYAQYEGSLYDWNQLYPRISDAIRKVGAHTPILVGGNGFSAVEWTSSWEPIQGELDAFNFQHGPDPEGHNRVENDLQDAIVFYWRNNALRPSLVYLPVVLRGSGTNGETGPLDLSQVVYWGYQIQALSESGAVDALVASHYDMLVLEPTRTDWSSSDKSFDTKGMVARLKNTHASDSAHRKLVIAYIDIGQAEDWRWYWTWSTGWDCSSPRPTDWPNYVMTCDPDGWTGNYPVAYWDSAWKDIIIYGQNTGSDPDRDYTSVIDEAIKDGFDGIYLDWVEAFSNTEVAAAARAAGLDPAAEMIKFIQEMRTYAAARHPGFIIIQQNAADLIDGHSELTSVIDAIAQEAIWYDGDANDDWNDPSGYDHVNDSDLVNFYLGYLADYHDAGLPVFDCEYALQYANTAYSNAYARGYIPYATRRPLSQLTTTPPPGY